MCDEDCKLPALECKCFGPAELLKGHTAGKKANLTEKELNDCRLALFTRANSDGSLNLVLRGNDLYGRYNCRITDGDVNAICRFIRQNPKRIVMLDLAYNYISDKGFFVLLKKCLIKARSCITHLNIMCNLLRYKTMEYLAKYAAVINLRLLRINGNKFGTRGGIELATFLRENKFLEYLDVGETCQTLSSVAYIITALRTDHGSNHVLKVLDLSKVVPLFNRHPYDTRNLADHLGHLLKFSNSIRELRIQKNQLCGHDMEIVMLGMRENKSLKYFDIAYNKIANHGVEQICEYLKLRPPMTSLNLAGNMITDAGARALSVSLPYSKIASLDLSHNKMADEGVISILHTLKKAIAMRQLHLWGNTIGSEACTVLRRMVMSGAISQKIVDVYVYETDRILYSAFHLNPLCRSKDKYYSLLDFGDFPPVLSLKDRSKPCVPHTIPRLKLCEDLSDVVCDCDM